MGAFSIWHWLIVLAVLVLVFGTKKLRNLGGDLGAAVRGFRQGMKSDDGNAGDDKALEDTQATVSATEVNSAEEKNKTGA